MVRVDACSEWRLLRPVVSQLSATSVRVSWSLSLPAATSVTAFKVQYRLIDKNQESTSSHWQTVTESLSPTRTNYDVNHLRTGTFQIILYCIVAENDCRSYYTKQ